MLYTDDNKKISVVAGFCLFLTTIQTAINTLGTVVGRSAATSLWHALHFSTPDISTESMAQAAAAGSFFGMLCVNFSIMFCLFCKEEIHPLRRSDIVNNIHQLIAQNFATNMIGSFAFSACGAIYYKHNRNAVGYTSMATGIGADSIILLGCLAWHLANGATRYCVRTALQKIPSRIVPLQTPSAPDIVTRREVDLEDITITTSQTITPQASTHTFSLEPQ